MIPFCIDVVTTAADPTDSVRFGLTALPNAAANAAGGLLISAAGALDMDEMNVDIEAIQASTAGLTFTVAGQVDANALRIGGTTQTGADVGGMVADTVADVDEIITTLGTAAGASLAADIAAIKAETAEIDAVTDLLPDAGALTSLATATNLAEANADLDELITTIGAAGAGLTAIPDSSTVTEIGADVDEIIVTLGAAAGASIAADIAAVKAETAEIDAVVDLLPNGGALSNLDAAVSTRMATFTLPTNFSSLSITAAGLVAIQSNVKKNAALAAFEFPMVLASDHVTGATGVTVTATRSIDGAAFAACANSPVEVANGIYKIDLAAADLNGNVITLKFTGTACDATWVTVVTQP